MDGNLTRGNPFKVLMKFMVPLLFANLFQQLYNIADSLMVGRIIGVDALGAVGCTGSVFNLIVSMVNGLTYGCTIKLGQRFGANDECGMKKSYATTWICSVAVSILFTAVCVPLTGQMLEWMRTPAEQIADATVYLRVIFEGITATVLFNFLANVCRALGDSKTPLYAIIVTSIVNIVLNFFLIWGCRLGVAGAAISTVIAQIISAVFCYCKIRKKFQFLRLSKAQLRPDGKEIKLHLGIGIPIAFQNSTICLGTTLVQFTLNGFGNLCVSGYTTAQKIQTFAHLPIDSVGVALASFTAQNYGARKLDRIRKGLIQILPAGIAFAVFMGAVNLLFGKQLLWIFLGDASEVIDLGYKFLFSIGLSYSVLTLLIIMRGTLQGLGKGWFATMSGAAELLMRVFGSLILGKYFGYPGLCWASPLAWLGSCVPLSVGMILSLIQLRREEALQHKNEEKERLESCGTTKSSVSPAGGQRR